MQRLGTRSTALKDVYMRDLPVSLFGLIFCTIFSVSVFAGNLDVKQSAPTENPDLHLMTPSEVEKLPSPAPEKGLALQTLATEIMQVDGYTIQHLANISNNDNHTTFVLSATVSQDSGRIEKIHIDSYDRGDFLGRKNLEMESFLRDEFTQILYGVEIFSIRPVDFDPENGGLFELQYLDDDSQRKNYASINFSLLKGNEVWILTNEYGQRINAIEATVNRGEYRDIIQNINMSANLPLKPAKTSPFGPRKNPVLQMPVATKIEYGPYHKISIVLELSLEGEIHAINFNMYANYGRHRKKRILLKNLFEETFESPQTYSIRKDLKISPISFHPLDFNPKDGGTFIIRYKNRPLFKPFSRSKEVVMSLIKDRGEWFFADEERRPINELWIKAIGSRVVKKIVADRSTPIQRKLQIHPCEESARALLN